MVKEHPHPSSIPRMDFNITLGDWTTQQSAAREVREEVFVVEQRVPIEEEMDEMDDVSLHAVACDPKGQVLATGRLLPDGHIGRMAVRKSARGAGIGGAILELLMQRAKARGDKDVVLSAQSHAECFYARYGYLREGTEFLDAGILHIQMRHTFT